MDYELNDILAEIKKIEIKIKNMKRIIEKKQNVNFSVDPLSIEKNGIILKEDAKNLFGENYKKILIINGYKSVPVWCKKEQKTVRIYKKPS